MAGPVTVCALALPADWKNKTGNKLKDSKKLTIKQREIWLEYINNHSEFFYEIQSISPKVIDKINISKAANLAATRAVKKLTINNKRLVKNISRIFLDGGLYLNPLVLSHEIVPVWKKAKTVIKGDEKIPAISLASIVAKVHRDKLMVKMHKKYPKYGFDRHKGYGTLFHRKAIKNHGRSPIHRLTFLKNL